MDTYPVADMDVHDLVRLTLRESDDGEWDALFKRFNSPEALAIWLSQATVEEIAEIRGVGIRTAERVKAAIELGKRISRISRPRKKFVHKPGDVAELLMEEMCHLDREHLKVVLLSAKSEVLAVETVSIGSLTSAQVHPREAFKPAIRHSAASIIIVHNHPSGDPTPSADDVLITRRLKQAGDLLGIDLLDHIIIGDHNFTSIKELGLLA